MSLFALLATGLVWQGRGDGWPANQLSPTVTVTEVARSPTYLQISGGDFSLQDDGLAALIQ